MTMTNVGSADLVSAWERALGQSPAQQALVLLSIASPESSTEELAQLSLGERDTRLLTLRERIFGSELNSIAVCPRCGGRIEVIFDVSDIRGGATPDDRVESTSGGSVSLEGYRVGFRLPNTADLSSIAAIADVDQAREQLLCRCIRSVARDGTEGAPDEPIDDVRRLPATVVRAVADRMAAADPRADTRLALSCPDCRHRWDAVFDIATYLADEIHHWVERVLREVHSLASAYGWRESDILAMTPARRRAYLDLLNRG